MVEGLSNLIRDSLAPFLYKGSGPVILIALAAIAVFVAKLLANVVVKRVEGIADTYFHRKERPLIVAVFGLFALVAIALGQTVTGIVMVVVGAVALLRLSPRRRAVKLRRVMLAALFSLCVSLWAEGEVRERVRQREARRLTVYVVFPFQPLRGEDPSKLRGLSMSLRNTLQSIFGSIADVSVEPVPMRKNLSHDDLATWVEPETVFKRLRDEGVEPDVLLLNTGGFTPDEERSTEYLRLLLRPRIPREADDRWEYTPQPDIMFTGKIQDISYLAIRASLALVAQIQEVPKVHLPPPARAAMLRKAACNYLEQLESDGCPRASCSALRKLLASKTMTLEEVVATTSSYPPDETERLREVIEGRAIGNRAKVGGPVEQPPADVPPTAPSAVRQPAVSAAPSAVGS